MVKPRVIEHDDVFVVRDDLFPGGTKARFFRLYSMAPRSLSMQARPRAALKRLLPL